MWRSIDPYEENYIEADCGVTYPSTTKPQTGMHGRAEYQEFVANLPRSGFLLSAAGAQRLLLYVIAQAYSENHADMADFDTYIIAFNRLYELGCFDEAKAEIGFDGTQRPAEPVKEPEPELWLGVEDLEGINLSTKAGESLGREIVSAAVFGDEAKEVWLGWLESLRNNFGFLMDADVQRQVIDLFRKNNWSFLDRRAYDSARLNLCRIGVMPAATCLTPEDRLSMSIESADDRSYEARRKLKQQIIAARLRQN